MGGTAHQPSLTAADGGSMPGPAKHPSLRHPRTIRYVQARPPSARRKPPYPELAQSACDTDPQPDSSLTLYAPASHVLRRPEVPEGILWRQAPTTNKKDADQAAQSASSHFSHWVCRTSPLQTHRTRAHARPNQPPVHRWMRLE
eukprot:scaffold2085_cov99-Isochrysis_galbana.AAC.1